MKKRTEIQSFFLLFSFLDVDMDEVNHQVCSYNTNKQFELKI